jgi:predicted nucleic acid-binding protein
VIVLLDTGPLGMLTNPRDRDNQEIHNWLRSILSKGYRVVLPEISDYELRRELLRANKSAGIERLDQFKQRFLTLFTRKKIFLAIKICAATTKPLLMNKLIQQTLGYAKYN